MKDTLGGAKKGTSDGLTPHLGDANATGELSKQSVQISCLNFRVVIEADENGVFVAMCPALLGCTSQGRTRAEALANIENAITKHLASLSSPPPLPINKTIGDIRA